MLLQITINPPNWSPSSAALHLLFFAALSLFLAMWLRKEITPRKFVSIWETDGVLSSRQMLAWVIAIYGMYMRYLGNLDNDGLGKCFEATFILFGIGGVVNAVSKYKPAPTVNAKQVDEMNVTPEPKTPTGGVE